MPGPRDLMSDSFNASVNVGAGRIGFSQTDNRTSVSVEVGAPTGPFGGGHFTHSADGSNSLGIYGGVRAGATSPTPWGPVGASVDAKTNYVFTETVHEDGSRTTTKTVALTVGASASIPSPGSSIGVGTKGTLFTGTYTEEIAVNGEVTSTDLDCPSSGFLEPIAA